MTTEQPIIQRLSNGAAVMLRKRVGPSRLGFRARHARFMPKGLSLALASAFSAAGSSISQTLAGLSITLAGLSQAQAQSQAAALPQGGVAVHGGATIQQSGKTLNVNTSNGVGNKSIINWQSFNIGAGHTTNINQPNAQSSSLNRVVTNVPSQIHGTLRSNGQVILVNQNGIAVGSGGVVDTAGFTASTLNISDADYKAGRLRFEGSALSGGVQVDGVIRSSNGDVVLFAPQIATSKDAVVKADNGNVIVGAGQSVELTGRGLEGVRFIIQGADNKAINLGTLQGNAVGVFAGTLRHSGVIQAQQATMEGGRVVLRAVKDVEISKDAQSISPAGPRIQVDGGVNAAGVAQAGGSVRIESAQGDVRIGAGSQISANASPAVPLVPNQPAALAHAAGGAVDIVANQGRVITEAGSVITANGSPGGTIRIVGVQGASVASVLNASSPSRGAADQAGSLVLITAQDVGGRVEVLSAANVSLEPGAQLLVSGDAGGGTILVGGDFQGKNAEIVNAQNTNVSQGVLLEANARVKGDGGKVIVWADNDTHFSGTLHAKGGEQGGDGGFGETSGKGALYYRGRADLGARRGRVGTLLLDPTYIVIAGGLTLDGSDSDASSTTLDDSGNGGGLGTVTNSNNATTFTINESEIEGTNANIVLQASNKISSINAFLGGDLSLMSGRSLSLQVTNAGSVGDGIDLSGVHVKTSGGGSINLSTTSSTSNGGITLGQISTNGGTLTANAEGLITVKALINTSNGNVNLNSYANGITFSNIGTNGAINAGTGNLNLYAPDGISMASATSVSGSQVILNTNFLDINTASASVNGSSLVWVTPYSSVSTSLGGTLDDVKSGTLSTGTLALTSGELARITTPFLKFGAAASPFTLNGNVAWATKDLEITASVIGSANTTYAVTAGGLGLYGVNGVSLTGPNTVANLAGKLSSGNFYFTNSSGFSVGSVGILQGLKGGLTGSEVVLGAGAATAIQLDQNIDTDGASIRLQAPFVRVGANSITLDSGGTVGNAGNIQFGTVTFSGDVPTVSGGTIFAANPGYGLTLSAAASAAGANGGTIVLPGEIGNHGGVGSYLQHLKIDASPGSGGNQGTVRMVGNVLLSANGVGVANSATLQVNNANLRIHDDLEINTNHANAANTHGGSMLLGLDAPIHGTDTHAHLMLFANGGIGGSGGIIDIGAVDTFGTSITSFAGHLGQFTASALVAGAGAHGTVGIGGNITTSTGGGATGQIDIQGQLLVKQSNLIMRSSSWNELSAGDISVGSVGSISALSKGYTLILDARPSVSVSASSSAGSITLGSAGNLAGQTQYLQHLALYANEPDGSSGDIKLLGDVYLDRGTGVEDSASLLLQARYIKLMNSVVVDTLQESTGHGGSVSLIADAISAVSSGVSLSLLTNTSDNLRYGGMIDLRAPINNDLGFAPSSVTINSQSGDPQKNGTVYLWADIEAASNGSIELRGKLITKNSLTLGVVEGGSDIHFTLSGTLDDDTLGVTDLQINSGPGSTTATVDTTGLVIGGSSRINSIQVDGGSAQLGEIHTLDAIRASTAGNLILNGSLSTSAGGAISLSAGNSLPNATLAINANISSYGQDAVDGEHGGDAGGISISVFGGGSTLQIANNIQIRSQGGNASAISLTDGFDGGYGGEISLFSAGALTWGTGVTLVSQGGNAGDGGDGLLQQTYGYEGGYGGDGGGYFYFCQQWFRSAQFFVYCQLRW